MAQSRDKRRRRHTTRRRTGRPATHARPITSRRGRQTVRRVAIALMIIIGLAGVLVATAPSGDEPGGRAPIG